MGLLVVIFVHHLEDLCSGLLELLRSHGLIRISGSQAVSLIDKVGERRGLGLAMSI